MEFLKKIVRHTILFKIFAALYYKFNSVYEKIAIFKVVSLQKKALKKVSQKERIKCVFLALFEEVWKVEEVYKLMEDDHRFDPVILVCPIVDYGHENMIQRMNQCFDSFKKKGYNVLKSFDERTKSFLDIRKALEPDILIYTNPYKGLIDDRYYITNFLDILTIYVPYYFGESNNYNLMCNLPFHNLLWRFYQETIYHKDYSRLHSYNRARNVVVTGYPGIENLISPNVIQSAMVWKGADVKMKRIIWAPHHTIDKNSLCNYSCFMRYSAFMIEMARKYCNEVQFVFKPHPLLKNKLEKIWGKKEIEDYYACWEEMPNTCVKEGEYADLFLTSDAMIHDSGSFLIEYLYVNKPVMRTLNEVPLEKTFNPFALKCLEQYYLANNEVEIEKFILNVINNVDPLKEQRTKFVNEVLMPKGSPSQNIIDDILDSIDNQVLYRN